MNPNKRLSAEYQRSVERFVNQNVNCCMSSIVSSLSEGDPTTDYNHPDANLDLRNLCENAQELCSPVLDYEEPARDAGWEREPGCSTLRHIEDDNIAQDWEEACEKSQVEPYKLEIFEHWCVSSWLAEKLEAKGERVDQDFAGLCVWGRTTTGQAICMDEVICDIYDALMS